MQAILRTQRILWAALLVASFIEAGISFYVPVPPGMHPQQVMAIAIAAIAVVVAVVSFVLPATNIRLALRSLDAEVKEEPAPPDEMGYRERAPTVRTIHLTQSSFRALLLRSQVPLILSLALSNAITLFGVVLSRLDHPPATFAPFLVVGSVLMAIRFPSEQRLIRAIERQHQAKVVVEGSPWS